MRGLLTSLMLLLASPVLANADADAFAEGRFAEAMAAGAQAGTVESLFVAGRAASTLAAYSTPDKARARALLEEAQDYFATALAKNPDTMKASAIRLQKAIAAGYVAKLDNSPGAAKAVRREFEAVIAARPDDAVALAAMGGWHGEAVATLGKFIAGTVLGAKEKEAISWFDRAMQAEGAGAVVPVFYASTLLNLSSKNAVQARRLLKKAAQGRAEDGFERLVKANGATILKHLQAGDVDAARAAAARLSPLGTIS